MSDYTASKADLMPLRFLLSPPASLDETVARGTIVTARMIGQLWDRQRLLENCAAQINLCMLGTAEQLWRQSLEVCYLREPRRSERIAVD